MLKGLDARLGADVLYAMRTNPGIKRQRRIVGVVIVAFFLLIATHLVLLGTALKL